MKTVSAGFDTGVSADYRAIDAKIVFRQIDIDAQEDVSITATSTESITDVGKVNDGVENSKVNYATFETDKWKLDGTFALLPDTPPYLNMGWWSAELSDTTTREFTNVSILSTGSTDHSTVGFSIIFDVPNNEYAEEFDIVYLDSSDVVIETVNITGNTLAEYVSEVGVTDWRKLRVDINKWSVADRRARVQELQFGIIETYTNKDDLYGFKIEEKIDLVSSKIESDKLEFEIFNEDNAYDILNPEGKYLQLQKKQEIEAYIGTKVGLITEYASCGVFYLDDWKTDRNRLSAKFTAYDKFSLLNQTRYRKGLYASDNIYDMIEDIFIDYGLAPAEYNIDSALSSIITTGFVPVTTHKEALKNLCLAGEAIAYCDSDGVIQIEQLNGTSTGFEIRLEDCPTFPNLELDKLIKQIDVDVITYTEATSSTDVFESTIAVSGEESFWIEHKPATTLSASVSVGSISSVTHYTGASLVTISHTGDTVLTITGKLLTESMYVRSILTGEDDGEVVKVSSKLIDTSTMASNVGNWVKDELTARNLYTVQWRHNPKLELTDLIDIENQFETSSDVRIYQQSYEYNGGMKSSLKGRA